MSGFFKRMGSSRRSEGSSSSTRSSRRAIKGRDYEAERQEQAAAQALEEQNALALAGTRLQMRSDEERKRQIDDVKGKTEVSTNRVDFMQGTMGLVDRMEMHPRGKLFQGAVISNKPPPDRNLVLSKLRTYAAPNDMARLVLNDIAPIDLKDSVVDIALSEAISPEHFKALKPYCLVSDVFVHYIPLDTFFTMSYPVDFVLNDFRKVEDPVVRHFPLSHSVGYNILFTLDYCVRKEDLKLLTLAISSSINSFRPGVAWGTVKIIVSLISLDFPIKANMQKTMGVMHLADSDLQDFVSDPRKSDGVLTPESMNLLRNFYKSGDIENMLQPLDDKKSVNTAPTVMNMTEPSSDVADLMRDMRQQHLEKERALTARPSYGPSSSRQPEAKGPPEKAAQSLRSSMKTSTSMSNAKGKGVSMAEDDEDDYSRENMESSHHASEDRGSFNQLSEPGVGDSVSDTQSSIAETLERPFSPPTGIDKAPGHRFRQVNFNGLN